jgi:hypothetical protein
MTRPTTMTGQQADYLQNKNGDPDTLRSPLYLTNPWLIHGAFSVILEEPKLL